MDAEIMDNDSFAGQLLKEAQELKIHVPRQDEMLQPYMAAIRELKFNKGLSWTKTAEWLNERLNNHGIGAKVNSGILVAAYRLWVERTGHVDERTVATKARPK